MMRLQGWSIGELATAVGVSVETVRYYQRLRLLPTPRKPYGGIRRYDEAAQSRLRFIKAAQGLGFSLAEVAELLRLEDGLDCVKAHALATRKLDAVRAKLSLLRQIEASLSDLVGACAHSQKIGEPMSCPLIAALQPAPESLP